MRVKHIGVFILSVIMSLGLVITGVSADEIYDTGGDGSDGSWCKYFFQQHRMDGYDSGCTYLTMELILLNSGTYASDLPQGEYWNRGNNGGYGSNGVVAYSPSENAYKKWSGLQPAIISSGIYQPDAGWFPAQLASGASKLSSAEWSYVGVTSYADNVISSGYQAIVGTNAKLFANMSRSEQISIIKGLYNSGYFIAFAVDIKGSGNNANSVGNGKVTAGHLTFVAGVDSNDIVYLNDPMTGKDLVKYAENGKLDASEWGYNYNLKYVIAFKATLSGDQLKITDLAGGKVKLTQSDMNLVNSNSGVTVEFLKGEYSEQELSDFCYLQEIELNPFDITSLSINQRYTLGQWENSVKTDTPALAVRVMRNIVAIFGVLITLYGIVLYIAFWFDKVNFLPLGFKGAYHILTFGRITVSADETSTWSFGSVFKKTADTQELTVNAKSAIELSVALIAIGVFILSGLFFRVVMYLIQGIYWLFNSVLSLFRG